MLHVLLLIESVEVGWESFSSHSFSFWLAGGGSVSHFERLVLLLIGGKEVKLFRFIGIQSNCLAAFPDLS